MLTRETMNVIRKPSFIHRKGRDTMSNTQRAEGHTPTPWYFTGEELNSSTGREICRMVGYISWPDGAVSANGAFIEYAVNNIERLEKVNEALVRAVEHAKSICAGNPEAYEIYCEAIRLAKEPA